MSVRPAPLSSEPDEPVVELPAGDARTSPDQAAPDSSATARLAFSYWEARGRKGGSAEEDWLRAEEALRARRAAAH